ncbi:alsin-like isoform X2 [Myripristis murdjan]|uniref:alsin-like isoform X2 n=1 Tax=Myripristis murdjan TaxID=586833 RepID=UPI0011760F78|nr:alsin-like isoform X2 [Myripristis murdjan]
MEDRESPVDEQGPSPADRGLLHLWPPGGATEQPGLERVLLSRPVVQVALGEYHGLLLTLGGLVYSFGELSWRQGLSVPAASPLLEISLTGRTVVRVAAGGFHCGALSEQGGLYMWGENGAGQCGVTERGGANSRSGGAAGGPVLVAEPCLVSVLDGEAVPPVAVRLVDLACGREHSLALSAQNEVWAWGSGCQLGLVTSTFPVWRPKKVEHLAGRHVIQVACGGYHSLALVRSLPPHSYDTQNPSEQSGRGKSPLRLAPEREELDSVDDAHYCPLGVELTEVTPGKVCPRRRSHGRRLLPGGKSASSSPGSRAGSSPSPDTLQNPPIRAQPESDGQVDSQTDGSSKPLPQAGCRANKNSAFPDEVELQDFLQRLSVRSLEDPDVSQGETSSLASHASDDSCLSSLPERCLDPFGSSYEDDSPVRRPASRAPPLGVEEVQLCVQEALQARKSSSLTDINQKEAAAASRRRSLPGSPSHGSPGRRRPAGRGTSCGSRAADEAADELPSLRTEVWSWGRGTEGQLGHGDQLARLQPLCIKSLSGEEVIKVAAGCHHSLALTAQCQVYSWGSNMCGQLGHVSSPVTVPQLTKLSEGLRVWDVSAGLSHSLLLADGDCVQPIIFYCGQQRQQEAEPAGGQRSWQRSPNRAEAYTVRPTLLPFCMEMGYVSSVCGGGQSCAALADQNVMGFVAALHELASSERQQFCWLSAVRRSVLQPALSRDSVCASLGQPCARLLSSLSESFVRLCVLIGRHSVSLSSFLWDARRRDVTSLPLLTHADLFLDAYRQYCSSVGNLQVMGGIECLQKLGLQAVGVQQASLSQLLGDSDGVVADVDLVQLFYRPLQQLHQYSRLLLKLATCYDVSTAEYLSLHHGFSQYESLSVSLWRRKKEAETTFLFWKTHSGKTTEVLRLPERRVVCESSDRSLTLQNAGRFSNHWFILFNDALVHTQFSSHHVYPLSCLWVKPVTENSSGLYAIKVTCPEESFTLVASTPQEKNKWLRSLNQAVDQSLGGAGQGSSPGATAVTRTASYTFTAEGRFKDAQYTGGWLAGRVHGRGTMKWPDGRSYSGNFKNGLEDGYAECVMPNKLLSKSDCYQGQWRDGKIHGFGTFRYASGEVYEGCFHDGQRHGYGMLSSGRLTRTSSSVFIGQWVHDRKTGYGVYDDITRGEKYMGLWQDDQRQGNAVVVTQFGLYYEGTFRDNRMTGPGLLLADDDTVFHGEFCEDWSVSGKGVLSLVNGDWLEGVFTGEWAAGLKVVGIFTKAAPCEPESRERPAVPGPGRYVVPAAQRWLCVFDECWTRLGCDAAGRGDRSTAWDNIAVTITTARRHSPNLSRSQSKLLESLELIPQQQQPLSTANYESVRRYLTKACETPLHPLGWLLETLVTAYRMTYVGVGSNRRLLRQAVQEIQAALTHLCSIVRFLFPGLPEEGGVIPDHPASPPADTCDPEQGYLVFSCSSLLLPLLLPRLYPPLFTLYCLQEEQKEADYWQRVLRLNRQPDQSLLSFLGVHEKFWPLSMSLLGEKKQIGSSSRDACFASAVETLQQISTAFTPADKLLLIQRTFEELTQEVKPLLDSHFLWCMDDLFPLFLYVVLRARIRNLGAEVSLIEDLMDPNIQHGELGLMLTTLKACYFQIQQESST